MYRFQCFRDSMLPCFHNVIATIDFESQTDTKKSIWFFETQFLLPDEFCSTSGLVNLINLRLVNIIGYICISCQADWSDPSGEICTP